MKKQKQYIKSVNSAFETMMKISAVYLEAYKIMEMGLELKRKKDGIKLAEGGIIVKPNTIISELEGIETTIPLTNEDVNRLVSGLKIKLNNMNKEI